MVVAEIGAHVDGVANAAKGQGSADAKLIGKGTSEEADDGKGRVQGRVCAIVCGGIQLAAAAHAVESIEHAGTHEADEGDNDELSRGRSEPGQLEAGDGEATVFP